MPRPKLHSLESCIAAAAGCTSHKQFQAKDPNAYAAARRYGWLDQACQRGERQPGWTYEQIAEVAKLYETRSAMHRSPHQHALRIARKNGWLDVLPPIKERKVTIRAKVEKKAPNPLLKHPLYRTLVSMISRCKYPSLPCYPRYGGRGVQVCNRWINGEDGLTGLECFILDMGDKPTPAHSIDRIDNDGDYCPENCRWANRATQMQNSSTAKLTEGQVAAIKFSQLGYGKLAKLYGVNRSTVKAIRKGKAWTNIDHTHLVL